MRRLTLLSSPAWPLPTRVRRWLVSQPAYVPIEILDPASGVAARRYPALTRAAQDDLVAVADDGAVWTGPAAWVMTLWALRRLRAHAQRLASPAQRLRAREVLLAHATSETDAPPPTPLRSALTAAVWIAAIVTAGLHIGALLVAFAILLCTIGGLRQLERAWMAFAAWVLVIFLGYLMGADVLAVLAIAFSPVALCYAFIPPRAPEPYPVGGRSRGPAGGGGPPTGSRHG